MLNFDFFILSELLTNSYVLIYSNFWIILICAIVIPGSFILMANQASGKIFRGLQGTAATTIIARGIFDAYRALKSDNPSSSNNNSENSNNGNDKNTDKNKSKNTSNKNSSNTGNSSGNISKNEK